MRLYFYIAQDIRHYLDLMGEYFGLERNYGLAED
jgi:hypothetical protein